MERKAMLDLARRLEQILQTSVEIEEMKESEWRALTGTGEPRTGGVSMDSGSQITPTESSQTEPHSNTNNSIQSDSPDQSTGTRADRQSLTVQDRLYIKLGQEKQRVTALSLEETLLTPAERQLVMLLAEQSIDTNKPTAPSLPEDERFAGMVSEWLQDHTAAGQSHELPEPLQVYPSLYNTKVPFLLVGESAGDTEYREWKKLLETYFESDVILIPLQEKEWLILADDAVLKDGDEEQQSEDSGTEQLLTDLALGLHEMVGEWIGESHISVYHPIVPANALPITQLVLRESITLGRTYHMTRNVHLPWMLHMEKLLNGVSTHDKRTFYEQVLRGFEHQMDSEMLGTLELFFEMDCNVSETAKRLYIHRNTLLYRLDKFKQETGLDVRNFSDAMLVKIALLLYKVTKRK